MSKDILNEYIRVGDILSKKYIGINTDDIIDLIVKRSKIYDVPKSLVQVCRDPDDDMFLACAIYANVKIIVSGDLDLLDIHEYQNIKVMKPRQFIDNHIKATK